MCIRDRTPGIAGPEPTSVEYVLHHFFMISQPPHLRWRISGFGGRIANSGVFRGVLDLVETCISHGFALRMTRCFNATPLNGVLYKGRLLPRSLRGSSNQTGQERHPELQVRKQRKKKYVLHHFFMILQPPHLLWGDSGFGGGVHF